MLWEGINIDLKATNLELTGAIHDYVIRRVTNLGKLLKKIQNASGVVRVYFEVAKTTEHHKAGQVFRADCNLSIDGDKFYSVSEKDDLYAAIDDCKDQLFREIQKKKEKRTTLFKRGAQKMKNLMRSAKFWK